MCSYSQQCVDEDTCSYSQQCMDEDMCSYSQKCMEENTVLTQGRIILWARGSLSRWWFHCQNKCSKYKSARMKIHVRILNSSWMKICVRILKCMEENTVLTKGRIILWAWGSLADDGSTVKTSVPIFNSVWMKIHVRILNSTWMKICVRILKRLWRKTLFWHKAE